MVIDDENLKKEKRKGKWEGFWGPMEVMEVSCGYCLDSVPNAKEGLRRQRSAGRCRRGQRSREVMDAATFTFFYAMDRLEVFFTLRLYLCSSCRDG
jgi:hypothetical protein